MPNTNEYHLYIHLDDDAIVDKSPVANKSQSTNSTKKADDDKGIKKLAGETAVYSTIKGFANQAISYGISTIELRTGAREYQQKMQFYYDVGTTALGIIEGAIIGGTVGGGVGAVLGAVAGVASSMISYAQKQNTIELNRTVENISIMQNNVRAGTANRRMNY